jgi:tripartite-type tricarboxylate transporter receptor subunit TctC
MKRRSLVFTLPVLGLAGASALAQSPVAKPLTIIVAYPPGGASVAGARRLARPLERELGRPIIVQNIPGASGAIGAQKLLQSDADGDTVLYGSANELILVPATSRSARYEASQFASVGITGSTALLLATGGSSEFTNVRQAQHRTRSDPSAHVSLASPGIGTLQHLVGAKLLSDLGIRSLHVPYKGAGPLIPDLISNQVDLSVLTVFGGTLGFLEAGRLRNLGVLSRERVPAARQLATIKETSGVEQPDYTLWGGLFMPAAAPPAAQQRLNDAVNAILADPGWREATFAQGGQPAEPMSLRDLKAQFESQATQFAAIARELAIRVD